MKAVAGGNVPGSPQALARAAPERTMTPLVIQGNEPGTQVALKRPMSTEPTPVPSAWANMT